MGSDTPPDPGRPDEAAAPPPAHDEAAAPPTHNEALVRDLKRLGPFGHGNRKPLLCCRGLTIAGPPRRVGKTGDHLQLFVKQGNASLKCIAFNYGNMIDQLRTGTQVDLAVEVGGPLARRVHLGVEVVERPHLVPLGQKPVGEV